MEVGRKIISAKRWRLDSLGGPGVNHFRLNGNLMRVRPLKTCSEIAILMQMKDDTGSTSFVANISQASCLAGRFLRQHLVSHQSTAFSSQPFTTCATCFDNCTTPTSPL